MGKPETAAKLAPAKATCRIVTTSLPIALAEKVDEMALKMDRPRGWIMKEALKDWMAWEDEKHRRILEGLADIDAGRVVSQETMDAWVASLGTDNELPDPQ